jgi:hypothetical protein
MRKSLVIVAALAAGCNNIGFVDKAKAVRSNEFGVEVFAVSGSTTPGVFLQAGTDAFSTGCIGITGINKANCICQAQAASRQFSGTFRAWISINGSVDAICNIQGNEGFNCSVDSNFGPFLKKDQSAYIVLAENYSELATTGFRVALSNTPLLLWTGTNASGRIGGGDCDGFANPAGLPPVTGDQSQSGTGYTMGQTAVSCNTGTGTILCMKQVK